MKSIKRFLYLFHRWSGVILSVLFGLWFASGFVMMYVGYPELWEEERYNGLPVLSLDDVRITPNQALAAAELSGDLDRFLLTTILQRPAYLIIDDGGNFYTVFADTGEKLEKLTPAEALLAAKSFSPSSQPEYLGSFDMDQWSVTSTLDVHRPLHHVSLNDAVNTELYISSASGQVVRDSTGMERGWNWLGTTIHWIYPVQLRRHVTLWENIIIYLSLAGVLAALSGIIIGTLRLRVRRRYSRDRMTPYTGVQRLHHVFGLIIGVFVLMFIFSGMMSMNPWGVFDSDIPLESQLDRYYGGGLQGANLSPLQPDLPSYLPFSAQIREIEWRRIGNEDYFLLSESPFKKYTIAPRAGSVQGFPVKAAVTGAVSDLIPDADVTSSEVLKSYDNYYYFSHDDAYRPLPVLRVKFNDPEQTWFHIDLSSGKVYNRVARIDRVQRWLFNAMHSLDFPFLLQNRPLWDIVVILLSVIGTAFSVTSVIIGWRRLGRRGLLPASVR